MSICQIRLCVSFMEPDHHVPGAIVRIPNHRCLARGVDLLGRRDQLLVEEEHVPPRGERILRGGAELR